LPSYNPPFLLCFKANVELSYTVWQQGVKMKKVLKENKDLKTARIQGVSLSDLLYLFILLCKYVNKGDVD